MRDEVRLVGGDGSLSGALSSRAGMKQTTYVMTTANTSANESNFSSGDVAYTLDGTNSNAICMTDSQGKSMVADGMTGAITAHSAKDAPVVCVRGGEDDEPRLQDQGGE